VEGGEWREIIPSNSRIPGARNVFCGEGHFGVTRLIYGLPHPYWRVGALSPATRWACRTS